jgi:hypothetical protein
MFELRPRVRPVNFDGTRFRGKMTQKTRLSPLPWHGIFGFGRHNQFSHFSLCTSPRRRALAET